MRTEALAFLQCPGCGSDLAPSTEAADGELASGTVGCKACRAQYPVLAGVLVLVADVGEYLLEHVKGISRYVTDEEIPRKFRARFAQARRAVAVEHIEEDLEAERVTALYVMNHYLRSGEVGSPDPVLDGVIKQHWDHGPFAKIHERLARGKSGGNGRGKPSLLELGCGVGGLYAALRDHLDGYLGLDSAFASVALARQLALGLAREARQRVPHDLLQGSVSREVAIPAPPKTPGAEFVVCDLSAPPVKTGCWQLCAALNVIDMLPEPEALPRSQYALLAEGGVAIQSCPYIWHPEVAERLRGILPPRIHDSAAAVEWLYQESGFRIEHADSHVPWVFFKNIRQLELYSVHLLWASK